MTRITGAARAERIDLLDALRGFALFGILLANILDWSGWGWFVKPEQQVALAGTDGVRAQYFFHHLFIDGKFYTLFSLLFGIGFALQLDRLGRRGLDGLSIFRRRLVILLCIGVTHMVLIWDGDILALYALVGLLLPFFRHWSDRALMLASGALIFIVPVLGHWLWEALGWRPHLAIYDFAEKLFVSMGGTEDPAGWLRREDPRSFFTWTMSHWPTL